MSLNKQVLAIIAACGLLTGGVVNQLTEDATSTFLGGIAGGSTAGWILTNRRKNPAHFVAQVGGIRRKKQTVLLFAGKKLEKLQLKIAAVQEKTQNKIGALSGEEGLVVQELSGLVQEHQDVLDQIQNPDADLSVSDESRLEEV